MSNEKANKYWEAELPPNYDRNDIERFIRAKQIPRKPRSQSLEESILSEHMSTVVVPPVSKPRWTSLDMSESSVITSSISKGQPPPPVTSFSLLDVLPAHHNNSNTPSAWATFD
ncbi:hypothetical protein ACFE04_011205 [Oxalis oulophora]